MRFRNIALSVTRKDPSYVSELQYDITFTNLNFNICKHNPLTISIDVFLKIQICFLLNILKYKTNLIKLETENFRKPIPKSFWIK